MMKYRPQRNYGCRIHDQYTYFNMRTIVLENELVRISLLLDKGTEIFEYVYKPKDLDFMWLTENGVQRPTDYLPTSPDPISTFIDYYPGGWQEVFPNGGPTSSYLGAQFGQHGEVAHMPWDYEIIEDSEDQVSVKLMVRTKKVPFQITKILSLHKNSAALNIDEQLENLSDESLEYMWGHHIALGKPFLEEGCQITLPQGIKVITEDKDASSTNSGRLKRGEVYNWPNAGCETGEHVDLSILPRRGTASEIVYLEGFDKDAWYIVKNPRLGMSWKVEWDGETLPYLWYWQEYGAAKGYPWYGRHYNIGLEPFAGYPTSGLEEAIRNGSSAKIGPRENQTFRMKTTPYVT